MSEDPMDLSALGAVDDAETVREAVRRFRRRVVVRSAWMVLAIFAAVAIVGHTIEQRNNDFRARIFEAPSWNGAVSTYTVDGVTVQVQKVTVIPNDRLGLVIVYGPARVSGRSVLLTPGSAARCPPSSTCSGYGRGGVSFSQSTEGCAAFCETYLAIFPIPSGREIPMTIRVGKAPPSDFTISLDDLEVPSLEGR